MSNLVLPEFLGYSFERKRNPKFSTRIKTTTSGGEQRQRFSAYPTWHFSVPIGHLLNNYDETEFEQLMGFINAHGGQEDDWLYDCPDYNAVDSMVLGTADGVVDTFQLRSVDRFYGFIEPVHNPKDGVKIYLNGELQTTGYTLGSTGSVVFDAAPANGVVVSWSGGYYHRCRFDVDLMDFKSIASRIFEYPDFSFIGSPTNKLKR